MVLEPMIIEIYAPLYTEFMKYTKNFTKKMYLKIVWGTAKNATTTYTACHIIMNKNIIALVNCIWLTSGNITLDMSHAPSNQALCEAHIQWRMTLPLLEFNHLKLQAQT